MSVNVNAHVDRALRFEAVLQQGQPWLAIEWSMVADEPSDAVTFFASPDQLADLYECLAGSPIVADVMRRRAHAAVDTLRHLPCPDCGIAPGGEHSALCGSRDIAPQELRHVGTMRSLPRWPQCPNCGHRAGLHDASHSTGPRFGCSADADGDPCACPVLVDYVTSAFISGIADGGL